MQCAFLNLFVCHNIIIKIVHLNYKRYGDKIKLNINEAPSLNKNNLFIIEHCLYVNVITGLLLVVEIYFPVVDV